LVGEFVEPDDHQFPILEARYRHGRSDLCAARARAEEFQRYQKQVEAAINDVTAKSYALAGADMTRATPLG
jgi:hypothetical protein